MIRGVNLGGVLVPEPYLTPSLFAITSCSGFYSSQTNLAVLDASDCSPILPYPVDLSTLTAALGTARSAAHLQQHYDSFLTQTEVDELRSYGVTHLRLPVPHYCLGDIDLATETYVSDGCRSALHRILGFVRSANERIDAGDAMGVFVDVHTAPGSQNGFDNSGLLLPQPTSLGFCGDSVNVDRMLRIVEALAISINASGYTDVVSGVGPINEVFKDCPMETMRSFNDDAFDILRTTLPPTTTIFLPDLFNASRFNDGYWKDSTHDDTAVDSHYYHVFNDEPRGFNQRQHIAFVCGRNFRDATSCCDDGVAGGTGGIGRIIGEYSAAFDTLPSAKLVDVMRSYESGDPILENDRIISPGRRRFLRKFVEAQIVAYEGDDEDNDDDNMRGHFFWNFKTEGGAFAEWNFLRGVREGWIPQYSDMDPDRRAFEFYGTCADILSSTVNEPGVVNEFPDPSTIDRGVNWQGFDATDDVVVHEGEVINDSGGDDLYFDVLTHDATGERIYYDLAVFFGASTLIIVGVAAVVMLVRKNRQRNYVTF